MSSPHSHTGHKPMQQPKAQSGTGYGGDARSDKKSRAAGKKRAKKQENALAIQQQGELQKALKTLKDTAPSEALLSTMKHVMRNQIPSEWEKRRKLYENVLEASRLVAVHHPRLLGDKDDDDSLLAALHDFSQHAELITKHDEVTPVATDKKLAKLILEIRNVATRAACRVISKPELSFMDSQEHYRQELRPLRFDLVEDLKGHAFASSQQPVGLDTRKLFQELTTYKTSLPVEYGSSIFVRAIEDRLYLLRAIITGPEETPYSNGIFVFDIYLGTYPNCPPKIQYMTTGGGKYRFNPNLYQCGKVCLSLLGTWSGPGWTTGESTLLQVLVSIQSLILVDDPFFNEPGYTSLRGTSNGDRQSEAYNRNIRSYSLECAILPFLEQPRPYPEFDAICEKHFRNKRSVLEKQLYQWNVKGQLIPALYSRALHALDAMDHGKKIRAKVALPILAFKTTEVDGVVEIIDDSNDLDKRPAAKRPRTEDEVVVLSNGNKAAAQTAAPHTNQDVPLYLLDSDDDETDDDNNSDKKARAKGPRTEGKGVVLSHDSRGVVKMSAPHINPNIPFDLLDSDEDIKELAKKSPAKKKNTEELGLRDGGNEQILSTVAVVAEVSMYTRGNGSRKTSSPAEIVDLT